MGKWLVKTEPDDYSIEDFERDGSTAWTGVRNALAQQNLRKMETGDHVLIYHSGSGKEIVGLASVTQSAFIDATDPKGKAAAVDLHFDRRFAKPVTLAAVKKEARLAELALVRISRLSVMPVSEAHWKILMKLVGEG